MAASSSSFFRNTRAYYEVVKPERTYANVMTTAAGFLFACQWKIDWVLLLATIFGTTFIVMSACALNNFTDHKLDAKMSRTKGRALVRGKVSRRHVLILAITLGVLGFWLLLAYVNALTALIGVIGYIDYVVLYGWSKRHSIHSTLIGTISGAAPIVAGYTAVTGTFDAAAAILGAIMVFWQMPHFYAIGIFRREDYELAGLPIWPVKKGTRSTQRWMMFYTTLYVLSLLALAYYGANSYTYIIVAGLLGLSWLLMGFRGLNAHQTTKWARGMFGYSLLLLMAFVALLPLSTILP